MTFSVKRAIADADLPPFEFEDIDGEPAALPNLQTLSITHAELALNGRYAELFGMIAPGLAEQIAVYPAHALNDLGEAWREHSGIEIDKDGNAVLGKSVKSSASSTTRKPATPSKRTSRSTASRSRK